MSGRWQRLYNSETTIDFVGRRWWGFGASIAITVVAVLSLFNQGLNLGIDFEGGVAWEAPTKTSLTIDSARTVLEDNGIDGSNAKIQTLGSGGAERIRIQVDDQTEDIRLKVQTELSKIAKVEASEVSVSSVSSSWGRSITEKAVRALLVFFLLVSIYIAWRFEWKMALSAILAMIHDLVISVGVYTVFGLEVTPATVVAFLTILGFSLYDTIVVFDKVHENTQRYSGQRVSFSDITNISMNQVLMRSLNTSTAALLPVASLLVVGSGIMGAVALQEFALALFVGLLAGTYSSIFIATPILALLKEREPKFRSLVGQRSLGDEMALLRHTGAPTSRRAAASRSAGTVNTGDSPQIGRELVDATTVALSHPPRPRKKRRR